MEVKKSKREIMLISPEAMKKTIKKSCFVVEVVDAINPEGTRSIALEKIIRNFRKPYVLVLNRIDLVPSWVANAWADHFKKSGIEVILTSAKRGTGKRELIEAIYSISEGCAFEEKIIGVICGVPKTGKSSILNMLRGKDSAPTSPYPGKPGYTKSFTFYKIGENVYIYDSPGVFPDPRDKLEKIIRSRPPEKILEPIRPSMEIIDIVKALEPRRLEALYDVDPQKGNYEILEDIAMKRGWVEKISKEPLVEESARRVIMDYLNGKLKIFRLPPKSSDL
ncbi:MAG: 50S ribosome-binding GTPase [Thermoprotei archaeon]|nr:50S ribosome-binding GTPase [Thermoprotei archaeon]